MKKSISILLVVAILCTVLLPTTFATDDKSVCVSFKKATRIELEEYYTDYATVDTNASAGSLVSVENKQLGITYVKTITLDVEASGVYGIEWIANSIYNADSSPMTLSINNTDVLKVVNASTGTIKDGRGNTVSKNDTSISTDAGYTVDVTINGSNKPYSMRKYSGSVMLNKGINTIELYTAKGMNWSPSNFVMDYIELTPSDVLEIPANEVTYIELENYYDYSATHTSASNGAVARVQDTKLNNEGVLVTYINLDVAKDGEYKIEWVANEIYNSDSSPMTLAVNGEDVLKVTNASAGTFKDGRGNVVATNDTSSSTDAGYKVSITIAGTARDYTMKKYNGKVSLTKGLNTIEIYTAKGMTWSTSNFAMDYVKLEPVISIDLSTTEPTRIELDQLYNVPAGECWNNSTHESSLASGGSYTLFYAPNRNMSEYYERSFNVYAATAVEYGIDFVASPQGYGNGMSRVELLLNGTEIIDAVDTPYDLDPTPDVVFPDCGVGQDMKLYRVRANLLEGKNTVTIKVTGEPNYNSLAFAVDYLQFRPRVTENIYEAWGDFEFEESCFRATRACAGISWVTGGALNSEHCLEISKLESQVGDMFIKLSGISGESYDVSFYVKSKYNTLASVDVRSVYPEGGYTHEGNYKINDDWTKVSFTVDCLGRNQQGDAVSGISDIYIRFDVDTSNVLSSYDVAYFDKLEAYPHGKVLADYSGLSENLYGISEDPQAPERAIESETSALDIYVDSEIGNDNAEGTKESPLASIEAARDMASEYADAMQDNIKIYIRGEQYLENTFVLNENHSGKNGYSIIYTSWGEEKATLTMSRKYSGFTLHDKGKNIWKTYVGTDVYSRQAYFNDVKGIRSRGIGYLENVERIDNSYFLCDNTELIEYKYPNELDLVFNVLWTNGRVLVDSITEENGRIKITPNSALSELSVTLTYGSGDRGTPSYIENAYELLDEKGEWYLNSHDGYMYYIPRNGEDMSTMICKLPVGTNMIYAGGTDYDTPLSNVVFDNIIFEGTTWLYPDRNGGFGSRQANYISSPKQRKDYRGAITFEKCQNIKMTNNIFRQLGFTGLEFSNGSRNIDITGNEFYDISSTAMLIASHDVGMTFYADNYSGSPYRRQQKTWCDYINITNNYIHDVARDYNGAAGVTLGHPRHTKFSHNEISGVPYSGLHIGWGWQTCANTGTIMYDTEIGYNYIHDVMNARVNDGAAIYTNGASSLECDKTNIEKNNRIIGNYMTNGWSCDYVYLDEGTTSWYVANNVSDSTLVKEWEYNFDRNAVTSEKHYWMHTNTSSVMWITTENNYSNVDYSSTLMGQSESYIENTILVTDRNWPSEAKAIMDNAGIEAEYRDNFDLNAAKVLACDNKWATLTLNVPAESGIMILGDNNEKYPLDEYNLELWVEDDAVTLDAKTGMLTARKVGTYEAEAVATINGITHTYHMMFECVNVEKTDTISLDEKTNTAYATVFYDKGFSGVATIAVYDADGKLIGIDSHEILEDYAALSAKYNGTAANVKVFVWDGFLNFKPLVEEKFFVIN